MASRIAERDGPLDIDGVQSSYNAVLDEKIDVPEAIVALGLAFGQLFVTYHDYEWPNSCIDCSETRCVDPNFLWLAGETIAIEDNRISNLSPDGHLIKVR